MKKKLILSILTTLFLSTSVFADEEMVHAVVGARSATTTPAAPANKEPVLRAAPQTREASGFGICINYDSSDPYIPKATHYIYGTSYYGEQVELEDGSIWKIASYDRCKVSNWYYNDPIIITQNHGWFSNYTYKLINQYTGSSIEANLFLGPVVNGYFTNYIISIDRGYGEVLLSDHSLWEVSTRDLNIFNSWAYDDVIIIGVNSGWDANCEAILINVTMNNFVRARQF